VIRLLAGTRKYLLTDPVEIRRNLERANAGAPVVVVIEVIEEDGQPIAYKRHIAYGVLTTGPVSFDYRSRDFVCLNYFKGAYPEERKVRGAYMTTGELLLAESADEPLAIPSKPNKSTKGN
jgi:hypothetical protein